MTRYSPRVLDASALVEMFRGHRRLMQMIDEAEDGQLRLILPTLAILEAETAIQGGMRMWQHFLRFRGLLALPLQQDSAIEVARICAPWMSRPVVPLGQPMTVGQVVYEAQATDAPVVTALPHLYSGVAVTVTALEHF